MAIIIIVGTFAIEVTSRHYLIILLDYLFRFWNVIISWVVVKIARISLKSALAYF